MKLNTVILLVLLLAGLAFHRDRVHSEHKPLCEGVPARATRRNVQIAALKPPSETIQFDARHDAHL